MIDEYVVIYIGRHGWSAVGIKTGQTGIGHSPRDAINNAIKATDDFIRLRKQRGSTDPIKPAPKTMSVLARSARPLGERDFDRGAVYRFERIVEDFDLPKG